MGVYYANKMRDVGDWAVAGRRLPWLIVLGTTAATLIGGGATIKDGKIVDRDALPVAPIITAKRLRIRRALELLVDGDDRPSTSTSRSTEQEELKQVPSGVGCLRLAEAAAESGLAGEIR